MALSKNLMHAHREELLSQVVNTGITDLFKPGLLGKSTNTIVPDEYAWAPIPKATFEDANHPLATVKVWREEMPLSRNQPMPVIVYVIEAGGRRAAPQRNWDAVYATAEALHRKMITALIADRKTDQPNFGRFA